MHFKTELRKIIEKNSIQYCIFDFDGVLFKLKTNYHKLKRELIDYSKGNNWFKEFESIWVDINSIIDEVNSDRKQNVRDSFVSIIQKHEIAAIDQAELIPGSQEAIDYLNNKNIGYSILSRNSKTLIKKLIEKSFSYQPDNIIAIEDVNKPKPDPEGMKLILDDLEVDIKDILYLGDTSHDVKLAKQFNLPIVLIINNLNKKFSNLNELIQLSAWQIDLSG